PRRRARRSVPRHSPVRRDRSGIGTDLPVVFGGRGGDWRDRGGGLLRLGGRGIRRLGPVGAPPRVLSPRVLPALLRGRLVPRPVLWLGPGGREPRSAGAVVRNGS